MKRYVVLFSLLSCFAISHVKAAKVDTIQIFSASMHKRVPCVIILPDAYSKTKSRFDVVYFLHGYSDNYGSYVRRAPNILRTVDMYQCIAVCPDGGFSSWYFDSPIDSSYRYETFVSKEVPDYIDSHYKTVINRNGRAIIGLSMGGHGALFLALKHKDVFGACASMSGGVDFTPFPNNWEIAKRLGSFSEHPQLWEKNTVLSLVDSLKNNELAISFECGTSDFFITVNRALHQKLLSLKIDHDYTERPGAHNWNYWNNAILYKMLFFHNFFTSHLSVTKS